MILAGYPDEMATPGRRQPGHALRFPKTIHFPDYSTTSCWRSSRRWGPRALPLDDGGRPRCGPGSPPSPRPGFGNGRLARNLFEAAVANQATRLVALDAPTDEQLTTLTAPDIPA